MARRILSVRLLGDGGAGGVSYKYRDELDHERMTIDGSGDERPQPELPKAMNALRPFAREIAELGESWAEKAVVHAIAVDYDGDGRRGIVISLRRAVTIARGPVNLSTPRVNELKDGKEFGEKLEGLADALDEVLAQTERYLDGDRAQMEIPKPEAVQGELGEGKD